MKFLLFLPLLFIFSCSDDENSSTEPTENKPLYSSDINLMPYGLEDSFVRIVGVLPNPEGDDDYAEQFKVRSFIVGDDSVHEYYILDDENVKWELSKLENTIEFNDSEDSKVYVYTSDKVAELLNAGDDLYLYNKDGVLIQSIGYIDSESGHWIYYYNYANQGTNRFNKNKEDGE